MMYITHVSWHNKHWPVIPVTRPYIYPNIPEMLQTGRSSVQLLCCCGKLGSVSCGSLEAVGVVAMTDLGATNSVHQ